MTRDDLWNRSPLTRRRFLEGLGMGAAALAATAAGAGTIGDTALAAKPTIKVGDKGFTESYLVADMYEALLQKHGFKTERHSFGTVFIAQKAITSGAIDLYPEYTGTGLLEVLQMPVIADPVKLYDVVKNQYEKRFHLTWLEQAPMNDSQGVALKRSTAAKYHITTMDDLGKASSHLTFVGLAECAGRADCMLGMQQKYGIHFKNFIKTTSPALNYKALQSGQADVAEVFTTDGQIAAYNLVVPTDDKHLWPPYHVAPVVRDDTLKRSPHIRRILNALAPHLTTATMASLNAKVDLNHQDHAMVARSFLKSVGLI